MWKRHFIQVQQKAILRLLAAVLFLAAALNLAAQGTAISYQGQLSVSGAPANTNYDFRFAVFTAPTNGTLVSVWLTNAAVPVSNGLFNAKLDFGPGVFNGTVNGSNDWLDIGVRAVGASNFTDLAPRQPILPVPYALFATSASNLLGTLQATQITGTVASSLISGTYSNGVNFLNGTNSFTGLFTGTGSNLTSLNASQITSGTLADARLASDVALLDQNQTFIGPNTFNGANIFNASNSFTGSNSFAGRNSFSGINTFTNSGNYFQGSFFGNGLVGWIPLSGTSTNAMRDAGYLLLNAGLSSVTLPATASLFVGDIVRVSGGGGGGWLVEENPGQSIIGNLAAYPNSFMVQLLGGSGSGINYADIAASADGVCMYAVGNSITTPGVNVSTDSGHTWNSVGGALAGTCISVACSANGKIVYAEKGGSPYAIEMSTNGGLTWSADGTGNGFAIACTANGTLISGSSSYACSGNGTYRAQLSGGAITVSTNGGATYTVNVASPTGVTVACLAASSDCTRLVAGVSSGFLYATSNQGATWTTLTASNLVWSGAWMSPDGSKFAATANYSSSSSGLNGGIFSCGVSPQPNTSTTTSSGGVCGSQGSGVELQYLGNGQFMPVGSTGLLWAN